MEHTQFPHSFLSDVLFLDNTQNKDHIYYFWMYYSCGFCTTITQYTGRIPVFIGAGKQNKTLVLPSQYSLAVVPWKSNLIKLGIQPFSTSSNAWYNSSLLVALSIHRTKPWNWFWHSGAPWTVPKSPHFYSREKLTVERVKISFSPTSLESSVRNRTDAPDASIKGRHWPAAGERMIPTRSWWPLYFRHFNMN